MPAWGLIHDLGLSEAEVIALIRSMTDDDKSCVEIAAALKTSPTTVNNWMRRHDIQRRPNLRNKEWLRHRYLVDGKSAEAIGRELGVTGKAVGWHLRKFSIQRRSRAEAQKTRIDAANRRSCPNTSSEVRSGPISYRFYFGSFFCASTAEYIFLKNERHLYSSIIGQPFVFQNRRPDFLLNGAVVLEVKDERRSVRPHKVASYQDYGQAVTDKLGHTYQVRYMKEEYPRDYENALVWLRANASRGISFTLLKEI